MDIDPYIERIHGQLEAAAEAGGEEARTLAQRLASPLDSAMRLAVLEALSAAADEITVELAPGSVELRLRGGEPQFVVTPPPSDPTAEEVATEDAPPGPWPSRQDAGDREEASIARINVRMPDHLKARVEEAAEGESLSVNAWLVRAAAARLEHGHGARRERRPKVGGQHYTGWAR
jgi:hypothetical protein